MENLVILANLPILVILVNLLIPVILVNLVILEVIILELQGHVGSRLLVQIYKYK